MLKTLELEAARADLADVDAMIKRRSSPRDMLARVQLNARRESLEKKVQELSARVQTAAAVALHFGGGPVVGSHGIAASFSSKILERYQHLVSVVFAAFESEIPLKERGPIKGSPNSQLLVTGLARGSFGFVLEEGQEQMLVPSGLKLAVESACDFIQQVATEGERGLEIAAEGLDARIVSALKNFFETLKDADAVLKVVEGDRSYTLGLDDVQRGLSRASSLEVVENDVEWTGELFAVPASGLFEFSKDGNGELVKGKMAKGALNMLMAEDGRLRQGLFPGRFVAEINQKTVQSQQGKQKTTYVLIRARPTA